MDYEAIASISVCIVGLTQLLKEAVGKDIKGRGGLFMSLCVGAVVCALYFVFNPYWDKIGTVLLSVSAAGIFYDTIYQKFKRIFEGRERDDRAY